MLSDSEASPEKGKPGREFSTHLPGLGDASLAFSMTEKKGVMLSDSEASPEKGKPGREFSTHLPGLGDASLAFSMTEKKSVMLSDSEASPERGKPGRECSTLFAGIGGCFTGVQHDNCMVCGIITFMFIFLPTSIIRCFIPGLPIT
jgi:hypothetical protein